MNVRWSCFSNSGIFLVLTLLSASVLFVTGNTLFYEINQLEVSFLMHSFMREKFLTRFDWPYTLSVRTTSNADYLNSNSLVFKVFLIGSVGSCFFILLALLFVVVVSHI